MLRKLLLVTSVLLITLSISCTPGVNQKEVNELNSHLDSLSASLQWTQKQLMAAEDSANNANTRITQLQEQLNQVSADISSTNEVMAAYPTYTTQSPALMPYYDLQNYDYLYGYQYPGSYPYPYPYIPPCPPPAPPLPPPTLTVNITASATNDNWTDTATASITVDRPTTIYVYATATNEYTEATITAEPLLPETTFAEAQSGSPASPLADIAVQPTQAEVTTAVAAIVTPTAVEQPVISMTAVQSQNSSPTSSVSTEATVTIPATALISEGSVSNTANQSPIGAASAATVELASTQTMDVSVPATGGCASVSDPVIAALQLPALPAPTITPVTQLTEPASVTVSPLTSAPGKPERRAIQAPATGDTSDIQVAIEKLDTKLTRTHALAPPKATLPIPAPTVEPTSLATVVSTSADMSTRTPVSASAQPVVVPVAVSELVAMNSAQVSQEPIPVTTTIAPPVTPVASPPAPEVVPTAPNSRTNVSLPSVSANNLEKPVASGRHAINNLATNPVAPTSLSPSLNSVTAVHAARPSAPVSANTRSIPVMPKPDPATTQQDSPARVTVPHNSVRNTSTAATSASPSASAQALKPAPAIAAPIVTAPAPPARKSGSNIANRIKKGDTVN